MARGAIAKQEVLNKILAAFPQAFQYDKEIRIPVMEAGEEVQIKVALTCAKTNVSLGADTAIPGAESDFPAPSNAPVTVASSDPVAPTEGEKKAVADLLRSLGL
jgi:hypothetical protein